MARPLGLKRSKRRASVISLTPLIDVVFILLVFFMLASSFQKLKTVEITPPALSASQPTPQTAPNKTIRIHILADQIYRIDAQSYTIATLQAYLEAHRTEKFVIETTDQASVQDLVSLLDLSGILGLAHVSLRPVEGGVSDEKP